jgi:Cu/Ag efflux protein CusF
MKQAAASIAFGIAISFTAQAYAAADAGIAAAAISVAAPDATIGGGSQHIGTILRGVVVSVDQRNDRITVRLSPNATAELRVRDGLLFNAVRYGDEVEVTVEDLNGAKTIVGLTKQ